MAPYSVAFRIAVAACAGTALAWIPASAKSYNSVMTDFNATVAEVRTGDTEMKRVDAAEHLFDLTKDQRSELFSDKTIVELSTLLDSSVDGVRYWVARSIGNFGKRAITAAPKLKTVLTQVDCLEGDLTSASGIRLALSQMGIEVPEPDCDADQE